VSLADGGTPGSCHRGPMNFDLKTVVFTAAGLILMGVAAGELGGTVERSIVERDGFLVIGIEARTSNAKETTPEAVIPRHWDRLFKEGVLGGIPDKADSDIVAVYTDYASDKGGEYTYLLGAKVADASVVPKGMVVKKIPRSRYAVFTTDKGPVAKVVSAAWREIWELEDHAGLGGQRAYQADFEVYDQRSRDPQNSQADIYVGLR